jgi:hypothetical protein
MQPEQLPLRTRDSRLESICQPRIPSCDFLGSRKNDSVSRSYESGKPSCEPVDPSRGSGTLFFETVEPSCNPEETLCRLVSHPLSRKWRIILAIERSLS